MDPRTPVIRLTNPQAHHTPTLSNATEPVKTSSPLHSRDQPLLRRYGYIFNGIKQGDGADGTATHSMPPSVDVCSALNNWMKEGESDDDHDCDNASTTTSSSSSATTVATSVHEPTPPPKRVAYKVTSSTASTEVYQAVAPGGPFSRSSGHGDQPGVLTDQPPLHMATPDVEMEADNEFENDVMVYYRAALSSSGYDEGFDFTPLSQSSHVPAPGSKEYEEYFEGLEKQFAGVLVNAKPRKTSSRQRVEVNPGFPEVPSIIGTVPPQIGYGRTIYNP